ncbi:hypothetical protein ACH5RR_041022 [Cinchona calisaya]|uniref:Uncharacterized protein n=1 Tax=Cinchona calisaya TaxID=153742 RepID=A0ABD2XVT0_9GENT
MNNGVHHQSQTQPLPSPLPLSSSTVQGQGLFTTTTTTVTDSSSRRFVWSVERHRRFAQIVSNLGIENALPEAILEEMRDVDGPTLEAVATHLHKYRLYLSRLCDVRAQQQSILFSSLR